MSTEAFEIGSAVPTPPVLGDSGKSKKSKKKGRGPQFTLPQIRSFIPVFNYYFKVPTVNGQKKRMPRAEKEAKWKTYRARMLKEFKRKVGEKFASEVRFIKRHTDPMMFLQYKLGRYDNLDPADLSNEQLEYYKEIGGTSDVQEMLRLKLNIDALEKVTPRKRKHPDPVDLSSDASNSATISLLNDDNHHDDRVNHNRRVSIDDDMSTIMDTLSNGNEFQTFSEEAVVSEIPKMENISAMDTALNTLSGGFTLYERELLDKKKSETFELFQEKLKAVEGHTVSLYRQRPELIGTMIGGSSLEDQMNIAFDFWVKDNMNEIRKRVFTVEDFTDQVTTARQKADAWYAFLMKWKLTRITAEDKFDVLWKLLVNDDSIDIEECAAPVL